MAESVGILGVEVINSFANPRSWAKNFLLGKKNSGWNSVSAGVVALRMRIAMPSLGAEFGHLH